MNDFNTRNILSDFIKTSEKIMQFALEKFDSKASCKIIPSLDLGFPHDVDRIAGGFPTGTLVTWESRTPFIPVDTTVNVCTSSMYELTQPISDILNKEKLTSSVNRLQESSYSINFHRGNHFIIFGKAITGKEYLFIHSSAAEFKRQFNGLYPVKNNWYFDDIQVVYHQNRYIRFLTGSKAVLFYKMAQQLISFNENRHDFFAEVILNKLSEVVNNNHFHHYCMPANSCIQIGCFLVPQDTVVPIFTRPGKPIIIFKVLKNPPLAFSIGNKLRYLVPHGWGKKATRTPSMDIDYQKQKFTLNDIVFPLNENASLRAHPDLTLRNYNFKSSPLGYPAYEKELKKIYKGNIVEYIRQTSSFNKNGYKKWL